MYAIAICFFVKQSGHLFDNLNKDTHNRQGP